ncbi:MAG TPA: methyltransferase domain-containing protein [Kofleriaceae bacterium]|nr:methyltransferase domain-containing protein [Kofleriaceae bacterium]
MRRPRPPRRPPGWVAPGPPPAGAQGRADLEPAADEDLSYLCGDWRLFQKRGGHRWSMDDLITAWVATRGLDPAAPLRALDLGCGLGSVLLLVAWRLPRAEVTGVEAQPERAALARRSIAYDGAADRCRVIDGDLRALPDLGAFDLVTGTPPYFPLGTRTESRAELLPSRFELRGGVEDYLAAAGPRLAAGGRIVMCSSVHERERVAAAAAAGGLTCAEHWTIVPRTGKPALVAVDRFTRNGGATAAHRLTVRDRDGAWTEEFRAVRDAMGLPSQPPVD